MVRSIIYTIVAIVVLIVIGFALRVYFQATAPLNTNEQQNQNQDVVPSSDGYNRVFNDGMDSRNSGDYVSAAEAFEAAIAAAPTDADKALAQRRAGVANFLTNDQAKQIEGVQQLKDSVDTAPNPTQQAIAISDLASSVCGNGCDPVIFAEVFKNEPYSQFLVADDMTKSVTNLYEWSLSISPVGSAAVRATTWYADQLLMNDTLTAAQKAEYVATMESHLAAGMQSLPPSGGRSEIAFYFWAGYAYGGMTTYDADFGDQFEANYQRSIALGKFEPDGSNKNYAVLFAYYQYAALLDYLYGDSRADDIEENLNALMQSVNNDPTPDKNQFLAMARNELSEAGLQHGFIGGSLYRLSEKYPDFKAFLASHGLSL